MKIPSSDAAYNRVAWWVRVFGVLTVLYLVHLLGAPDGVLTAAWLAFLFFSFFGKPLLKVFKKLAWGVGEVRSRIGTFRLILYVAAGLVALHFIIKYW